MSKKIIHIPDIGGAMDVDVIEILVSPGDTIAEEDSLITLESDKATMEIPAPFAGVVADIKIAIGDKVSEGDAMMVVEASEAVVEKETKKTQQKTPDMLAAPTPTKAPAPVSAQVEVSAASEDVHAGPGVRRFARALGVDLSKVRGTGPKSRVQQIDVQNFIKQAMTQGGAGGLVVAPAPSVDFAKYGEIETKALNKIKRATAKNLHRNWVTVPHVTQFNDADITDMEAHRQQKKSEGVKLTPLVYIMKALAHTLVEFPTFNASLDASGEHLVMKKYFHIGVAVDTPNGLVVPVVRDVDQKTMEELAGELKTISTKARDTGLSIAEMLGGCMTISSLGGIGGTAFTPIVNAPEVAILGVSRSLMKPVYQEGAFVPRLMLPLSLSYDHRVIDGAEAARFITHFSACLADVESLLSTKG